MTSNILLGITLALLLFGMVRIYQQVKRIKQDDE